MEPEPPPSTALTAPERALAEVWQRHTYAEFVAKDVEAALATMTDDPYVLLVPLAAGGAGKDGVRRFYGEVFIPQFPPDLAAQPLSLTVGQDRLVEEAILRFTHSTRMDWILPGVPPTGRVLEVPYVGVIGFRGERVASEHLYWDQASVLVQAGLLAAGRLPVVGAEGARAARDPGRLAARPGQRPE
jgi:carboxymethylenebutenolidase